MFADNVEIFRAFVNPTEMLDFERFEHLVRHKLYVAYPEASFHLLGTLTKAVQYRLNSRQWIRQGEERYGLPKSLLVIFMQTPLKLPTPTPELITADLNANSVKGFFIKTIIVAKGKLTMLNVTMATSHWCFKLKDVDSPADYFHNTSSSTIIACMKKKYGAGQCQLEFRMRYFDSPISHSLIEQRNLKTSTVTDLKIEQQLEKDPHSKLIHRSKMMPRNPQSSRNILITQFFLHCKNDKTSTLEYTTNTSSRVPQFVQTSGGSSVGWFSRIINSGLQGSSVSLYSTNLGAKINLKCTRQLALGSSRIENKTVTDQQVADAENT
uniref:Uncharacterized protein n=1 Tax=Glossina pallidipes TaxID=7398 RepID=A0A1A9ZWB3_GLOPL